MNKIKSHLNSLGLTLVFAGLAALRIWPHRKTAALIIAGLGVAALIVYLVLHLSHLKKNFKRKSFLYSSNMVLIVVIVLAILVLVNVFLAKQRYRIDFTETKLHSLSDQSVTVLKNLKHDVRAKAFFRDIHFGRGAMENLLKIYAYHSGKFSYEFIDPDKNPGLVKRYDITQDGTTVLEYLDRESRITSTTEEEITNTLIKITRDGKKTIYFLEGHGQPSIEESGDGGFSQAKNELEKMGYEVGKMTLALTETFPADCDLLIVPGPRKDLLPDEKVSIRRYLGRGGRVFLMIDPETAPDMIPFLHEFGIRLEDDLIVDTVSRLLGGDYFMPVVSEYESHEISRNFRYATFFPFARSVELEDPLPDGVSLTVLARTSSNAWAERQLDQKEVRFDPDKDRPGPISLAVVGTISGSAEALFRPEEPDLPHPDSEGRIAVFGDSDFITNRYFNFSGNGNFFLNTVNWLTEEADLISIQPRTAAPRTLRLTPSQGRLIFFTSVVVLPLAVLLLGLSVWLRRRAL
ncbi:MAG: Gldg family protein [Acidobacteriota bacterium]|nr:Gldg family protein [Acidobacteriota bacterium]